MESFFSSLKTERVRRTVYRTRDAARANVFDYIERFYNTIRRRSTIGYLSPVEFERRIMLAQPCVHGTGSRPSFGFSGFALIIPRYAASGLNVSRLWL